jgi:hypothetical protein
MNGDYAQRFLKASPLPSPIRPSKFDDYDDNNATRAPLVPPLLHMSCLRFVILVDGGGCLKSMNIVHFLLVSDKGSTRIIMHVLKLCVVLFELGSTSIGMLWCMSIILHGKYGCSRYDNK